VVPLGAPLSRPAIQGFFNAADFKKRSIAGRLREAVPQGHKVRFCRPLATLDRHR
jgi:hypothetical protein